MDTIVHLVQCGVEYKCLSVVVNEKIIFQGFTILMSAGSELTWELQYKTYIIMRTH
jgi:hypothetical protein